MKGYRPSIRDLQREFAQRLAGTYNDPRTLTRNFDQLFGGRGRQALSIGELIELSSEIELALIQYLPTAEPEEAVALLRRSPSIRIAEAALSNRNPEVKALALQQLREVAAQGDPLSQAIVESRETP